MATKGGMAYHVEVDSCCTCFGVITSKSDHEFCDGLEEEITGRREWRE